MSKKGFIMPTVLSFVLISSGIILVQIIAVITQTYGLKAQIDDLFKLEYAVNSRRVIEEINNETYQQACDHQELLGYEIGEREFKLELNCVYTNTEIKEVEEVVKKLMNIDQISLQRYGQIVASSKQYTSKTVEDIVKIKYKDQSFESDAKFWGYVIFVSFDKDQNHILLVDEDKNITRNISVK